MKKGKGSMDYYYPVWFLFPAGILFLIFFILPNLASFGLAFTDWTLFFFDDFHFNGLENFRRLFSEKNFWLCIRNTFYFAIVTLVLKNVFGFLLALLFKKTTKLNSVLRAVIFMPFTISPIVVAIIFIAIYNPTNGIINQVLNSLHLDALAQDWLFNRKYSLNSICLMEVWQQTGYNMCIFIAGMQGIPKMYYEAASIDGANYWQQVRHITIPLLVQSFTVTMILNLVSGIKVFSQVYGTTNGGPANATEVLGTFLYKSFGEGYLGYSAAVGLFTTILILVVASGLLLALRKREVEM